MTKSLTEQYNTEVVYIKVKDDQVQKTAYTLANFKPDYSKMYFVFNFTDGKQAKFRMDKDCHTMQQFLDRMNKVHELEKQLAIATKALKEYTKPAMWELDGFCYMDADTAINALKEIEEVK